MAAQYPGLGACGPIQNAPPYYKCPHPEGQSYPPHGVHAYHPVPLAPPVATAPPMAYDPPVAQAPPAAQARAAPVMAMRPMAPHSTRTICQFCNYDVSTRIKTDPTSQTHLWACLLFMLGCWCCCCIPYCTDSCMNVNHYCPNCEAFLGSYRS